MRPATRVYRAATRLYPRAFREEYGDDLVALFEEQTRDEPAARVAGRAVLDLIVTVPIRHLEVPMPRRAPTAMFIVYTAIAIAGVVAALLSGTNYAVGTIGFLVTIGASTLAIITWRRSVSAAPLEGSGAWWKLPTAGAVLIGSVVIGAQAEIEQWYLAMAMVLAGIALILAGLILGVARLVRRPTPPAIG